MLFFLLFLAACSEEIGPITAEDIPNESPKEEIITTIQHSQKYDIDDIIEANFPKITTVEGDSSNAEIYATTQFSLEELSSLLTSTTNPKEVSDIKDQQQIFIYPNDFVTLKESEADSSVLLIEVASDEFVRQNYSPNFLSTYFTLRLLEEMLGVDDWGKRGGSYSGMGGFDMPTRGNTTFRGGGPGAGK